MDRRLFEAVKVNAKRLKDARTRRASTSEIAAIRETGRAEIGAIRARIEAVEPDDGSPDELWTREHANSRRRSAATVSEWFRQKHPQ